MRYYLATVSDRSVPPNTRLGSVTDDGRSLHVPAVPLTPEATEAAQEFCDPEVHGESEVWSYEATRDGAICAGLLGQGITCNDLKAWAADCGNPTLPAYPSDPNNALLMATWTQQVYYFLARYDPAVEPPIEDTSAPKADPGPSIKAGGKRGK